MQGQTSLENRTDSFPVSGFHERAFVIGWYSRTGPLLDRALTALVIDIGPRNARRAICRGGTYRVCPDARFCKTFKKIEGLYFAPEWQKRRRQTPRRVRAAILDAFVEVGGSSYLVRVANEYPAAFCALLGKSGTTSKELAEYR
jgi:hypothetical protein